METLKIADGQILGSQYDEESLTWTAGDTATGTINVLVKKGYNDVTLIIPPVAQKTWTGDPGQVVTSALPANLRPITETWGVYINVGDSSSVDTVLPSVYKITTGGVITFYASVKGSGTVNFDATTQLYWTLPAAATITYRVTPGTS